jgi:hypothetical protein
VLAGCSGNKTEPKPTAPPPIDAGIPIDGITEIGGNDPNRFTDPDPNPQPGQSGKQRKVPARPIDIMLKSTPPGAWVSVDNIRVGRTPTYWFGETDGHDHEFTFVLPGYALGRYRFVPIQSGTVHARLEPVSDGPVLDGGIEDPVTVQPGSTPSITPANPGPPAPVKPPDTVLSPGGSAGSSTPPTAPPPSAPGSGTPGSGTSGSAAQGSGSVVPKVGPQP